MELDHIFMASECFQYLDLSLNILNSYGENHLPSHSIIDALRKQSRAITASNSLDSLDIAKKNPLQLRKNPINLPDPLTKQNLNWGEKYLKNVK